MEDQLTGTDISQAKWVLGRVMVFLLVYLFSIKHAEIKQQSIY